MSVRIFALVLGIIYLVIGIAGFIPGLVAERPVLAPDLAIETGYGYLLGLFPVNVLHNLVHLAIGAWGVFAYASLRSSVIFSKGLAIIFGILFLMGLFPLLNTTFGLIPLFGNDLWLHLITAAVAGYFGWFAPAVEARTAEERPGGRY